MSTMKTIPSSSKGSKERDVLRGFLSGVRAVILETRIGKTRVKILTRQLENYGGIREHTVTSGTSHIIAAKGVALENVFKQLKLSKDPGIPVVEAEWLSTCFVKGEMVECSEFLLQKSVDYPSQPPMASKEESDEVRNDLQVPAEVIETPKQIVQNIQSNVSPVKQFEFKHKNNLMLKTDSESSYVYSGTDSDSDLENSPVKQIKLEFENPPPKPRGNWVCAKPSSSRSANLNEHITSKLEILCKAYTNTQDKWRAFGYQKAISAIKNYSKRIESYEEVTRLPFVGERLAKKIWEIIETGCLRRLDYQDAKMDAINLFADVWGAGPKTAEVWIAQGYRTLEDLKQSDSLNFQQKIGLKYYNEFLDRMPRSEAEEIFTVVRNAALEINKDFELVTCGSYRRGRASCGDIDILISHPDGKSHEGILCALLEKLKINGFITDDLVTVDKEGQRKYMGVFLLKGENRKHRRIDIIVAPYSQWPCALLHFTGSGHFNRSMRHLAKTKGMSLSEHALRTGVVRKGKEILYEGNPVPIFSERDVFTYLGLDFLEPHDRDW